MMAAETELEAFSENPDSISAVFESPDDDGWMDDGGESLRRLFDLNLYKIESPSYVEPIVIIANPLHTEFTLNTADVPVLATSIHFEEHEIYLFQTEERPYPANQLAFGRRRRRFEELNPGFNAGLQMQRIRELIIRLHCELILVTILIFVLGALLCFVIITIK